MTDKKNKLENWIGIPVIINTENYPNIEGNIREEEKSYWFVNEEHKIKIRLAHADINNDVITGIGQDLGYFKYTIKKKN